MTEAEVGVVGLLALKVEGGHEPRNVGNLCELEKAGKQVFPWDVRKEHSPADLLNLAQ